MFHGSVFGAIMDRMCRVWWGMTGEGDDDLPPSRSWRSGNQPGRLDEESNVSMLCLSRR